MQIHDESYIYIQEKDWDVTRIRSKDRDITYVKIKTQMPSTPLQPRCQRKSITANFGDCAHAIVNMSTPAITVQPLLQHRNHVRLLALSLSLSLSLSFYMT